MTWPQVFLYFSMVKSRIARAAGCTRQNVEQWQAKGEIPRHSQLKLEKYTKGALKARPLLPGEKMRCPPPIHRKSPRQARQT